VTGQFGKTIWATATRICPPCTGSTCSFGNMCHLNAEEEPENEDYPKDPAFKARFAPRGVLKCVATSSDTSPPDPRFGKWGNQMCEDTGPLTKKRMETIDEEFLGGTLDFIGQANKEKKPFFVWFNSTRMHIIYFGL
jgi:arylsulfatase